MNQKDLTRRKLVDVVRDYYNDVCTDGSTCMVYEYKEKADKTVLSHTIYEMGRWVVSLGGVKCFGNGKWLPLVRGGGFYVSNFGNKETRFYLDKKMIDVLWENTSHFGGYLGAGVQMALGKHYARLHADLYRSIGKSDSEMKWGITAEFAL